MTLSERFRASDDVVALELGGGTILHEQQTGNYFSLDRVGTYVWDKIQGHGSSLNEIVDFIASDFDASPEVIQKDVLELIDRLVEMNLAYRLGDRI
jgi:hypothetical protein